MATTALLPQSSSSDFARADHEENGEEFEQKFQQLVSELPKERGWVGKTIHQYEGFWYATPVLKGILILQQHFKAQPDDVLLVSYPKSGTTWLKALMFTIMNRKCFHENDENPLHKSNPHELVNLLETYANVNPKEPRPAYPVMNTHISYTSLPDSIKTSGCRIVYAFRDPKDILVSCWHFANKIKPEELPPISLAEAFEQFSRGASPYGPYWDHVLGYWKASLEWPNRYMFLSYEDLKRDPCFHAKRLAEFLGHPFSPEEEKEGLVSKVVELCSFENLSNLEVNKTGKHFAFSKVENKIFFRQGKVGDAKNHLPGEMMRIMDEITEEKFKNIKYLNELDSPKDEKSVAGTAISQKDQEMAAIVSPSIPCTCTAAVV